MRAVLRLELIADDYFWQKRRGQLDLQTELRHLRRLGPDKSPSWVARLTWENGAIHQKPLRGTRDYSQANSTGSRGIFEYFPLADGVYEINDRYHWKRVRHYYLRVEGETMTEITREEAAQWLMQTANVT